MHRVRWTLSLILCGLLSWAGQAAAQSRYAVVETAAFHAESLDARGVVVGALYLPTAESRPAFWAHAAGWPQGTVITLPINGFLVARNALGQMVGGAYQAGPPWTVPLEWNSQGHALWPVPWWALWGQALAINHRGQGLCAFSDGGNFPMPARCNASGFEPLATADFAWTFAWAINRHGWAAGSGQAPDGTGHVLVWDAAGQIYDYGNLGGGALELFELNDAGQFAGWAQTAAVEMRAFGGDLQQGIQVLPHPSGFDISQAYGLNNAGVRVGVGVIHGPEPSITRRALRWDAQGHVQDLNDLIGASTGWTLVEALAVNDAGQILALASGPPVNITPVLLFPISEDSAAVAIAPTPAAVRTGEWSATQAMDQSWQEPAVWRPCRQVPCR
jgi:hypothetical protein